MNETPFALKQCPACGSEKLVPVSAVCTEPRGSGSSPHRARRRCGGKPRYKRVRRGTGEVSVTARSCDVTRGLVRTTLPGRGERRRWLIRRRVTHSRCSLPRDPLRAQCSDRVSPGSGATVSLVGPLGSQSYFFVDAPTNTPVLQNATLTGESGRAVLRSGKPARPARAHHRCAVASKLCFSR